MGADGNLTDLVNLFDRQAIFKALAILVAAWIANYAAQRTLAAIARKASGSRRLYILASVSLIRLIIIVSAVVLIIPIVMEPSFENLVAFLGAAGVALGFAFKDYISSLIAGIVTLFEMPFRPGDWIEIGGHYGEVRRIGMRTAEIATPDDDIVVIPHSKIWNTLIANSNGGTRNLMCVADLYLKPDHDGRRVKEILYDTALTSVYLQHQMPMAVTAAEKPFGTHYRLKAYPNDPRDQFKFTTDLTLRAKQALADEGFEFSSIDFAMGEMNTP